AAEVLAAVLRDQPAELDESGTRLPISLKQVIARCLAKQPAQRFQSAGDVANALKKLNSGAAGEPPPEVSSFPNPRCVAVLPLQNFSSNKSETGYFADGMTEVLIAELAKNRALRVVSRTTVMPYKDSRSPLRQIARELGADTIVEGSVLLADYAVRI